jgi:hypothetical protein
MPSSQQWEACGGDIAGILGWRMSGAPKEGGSEWSCSSPGLLVHDQALLSQGESASRKRPAGLPKAVSLPPCPALLHLSRH